ncbi:MAG: molybdopterin-dependent oxidoreductase [Solirubrobacterales bacterium]|nr:molybdopterin-dependent oxidoreductase [Solirubrobacterales bacterium]
MSPPHPSRGMPTVGMEPNQTTKITPPPTLLRARVTDVANVYVIGHLGIARVDARNWSLRVAGMVRNPFEVNLDQLRALPSVTLTAVLECYGNPLQPDVPTRRVANLTWRGVPVRTLLDQAQPDPNARFICAEGLDAGEFDGTTCQEYLKDLPLDIVARRAIIAYEMNGEPLTYEHGFPARLFTPGYFGTNQVKWLRKITVTAERPKHLFTTRLYQRTMAGSRQPVPVREVDVNSVITAPSTDASVEEGDTLGTGWAWSTTPIKRVEIAIDGDIFDAAVERRTADEFSWQEFSAHHNLAAGSHIISARATDTDDRIQPLGEARNQVHSIKINVRAR